MSSDIELKERGYPKWVAPFYAILYVLLKHYFSY
jgi:hypothetical protein